MRICVISEYAYPVIRGGLGEWIHKLMQSLSDFEFDVFCLTDSPADRPVYPPLPNVRKYILKPYSGLKEKRSRAVTSADAGVLAQVLSGNLNGAPLDLERLVSLTTGYQLNKSFLYSKSYWDFLVGYYRQHWSSLSFNECFWAVLGIQNTLLDTLKSPWDIPECDIYHSLTTGFGGIVAAIAKILYRKPAIIMEQGLWLKERHLALERMDITPWLRDRFKDYFHSIVCTSFKYADRVTVPCRSHIDQELPLGLDIERLRVIDNGIECNKFIPGPPRHPDVPVIGCFARIVPVKGLEVLIEAARIVRDRCPGEFVVVGEVQDKNYFRRCLKMVEDAGLSGHFKFTGFADPLKWYHSVDIFTLTSHSEGVPYALLEAMSCGLPVVCTAVGGMPEIITGETGFVVPPNEPEKLAEKLIELIKNKDLRMEMGQNGRKRALARFKLSDMAARFRDLYQEVCP